jgi:hypothetical protein
MPIAHSRRLTAERRESMKTNGKTKSISHAPNNDIAATYNAFKEFEGRRYTGMKIGRSHKWHYDPGDWKETKITPDQWEIQYSVMKRRAGKAPEGSGVPVGTSYHWYILAHQNVTKVNANDYTTSMTGMKFKLAHRRADNGKWSASDQAQRRNLVKILRKMIEDLEQPAADAKPATAAKFANGAATGRSRTASASKAKKPSRTHKHRAA